MAGLLPGRCAMLLVREPALMFGHAFSDHSDCGMDIMFLFCDWPTAQRAISSFVFSAL